MNKTTRRTGLGFSLVLFVAALLAAWLTQGTGVVRNDLAPNISIPEDLTMPGRGLWKDGFWDVAMRPGKRKALDRIQMIDRITDEAEKIKARMKLRVLDGQGRLKTA